MDTAIKIENVSFSYGEVPVLEEINLTIEPEEFFGLIGPNAAGKSTLLRIILGLLKPDRGRVTVFGKPAGHEHARIGYVPQYPSYSSNFPITVAEVVALGRIGIKRGGGRRRAEERGLVQNALRAVEIEGIAQRQVNTLSGGQMQRMLIARALAGAPEILILDEPTANIDVQVEEDIFALLREHNSHMTIIVVSHDIAFISGYVDRVGCLNRTLVCHEIETISGKTIEELYGMPVKMIHHVHQ